MGIASPVRLIWRPVPEPGEDSNASLRVDAHRTLASLAPRASRERERDKVTTMTTISNEMIRDHAP